VPTLALPLAALGSSPHWLVVIQLIPLLVLVASVRSLLESLGVADRAAWIAAGAMAPSRDVQHDRRVVGIAELNLHTA
jgi:hypothetical protein